MPCDGVSDRVEDVALPWIDSDEETLKFIDYWFATEQQLELRKLNDDPMELDEIILHVHKVNDVNEEKLRRELNNRFVERTEITPNRIIFHDADEMRRLQGVGRELKEQKIIDRRPKRTEGVVESGAELRVDPAAARLSPISLTSSADLEAKP